VELLSRAAVIARLARGDERRLCIRPILDDTQVGEVSFDLRLGVDFEVSVLTRKPFVGLIRDNDFRSAKSYFRPTRRELGDRFILYPNQIALACTLEYIGLPSDIYADILSRSSYTRLGIHVNTMIQPGFRGCFPLELFNHGNNPVEIVVGSRICQARFFELSDEAARHSSDRKYFGHVRPVTSRAADDADLAKLEKIREQR
jgi:dCTP deaminase